MLYIIIRRFCCFMWKIADSALAFCIFFWHSRNFYISPQALMPSSRIAEKTVKDSEVRVPLSSSCFVVVCS